jgi:hypothetical protein
MGSWGTEVFANDEAMDWVAALEDADDVAVVERALHAVNVGGGHVDAVHASIALAAAEVVATLLKKPGDDVPSEVFEWIARVGRTLPPSLISDARSAIERIASNSELLELREDGGEAVLGEWRAMLADLRGRLD